MWSKVKNTAKMIGRGAAGIGRLGWNGVKFATGRMLRSPEWAIGRLGFRWNKKLRLDVVILSDHSGPIATPAEVVPSVEEAIEIFRRETKVDLVPVSRAATPAPSPPIDEDDDPIVIKGHGASHTVQQAQSFIRTLRAPAPGKALDVRCNFGAFRDELSKAGMFFNKHRVKRPFRRSVLTVYIVRSMVGKKGCSLGPFANYVTVALDGLEGTSDPCADVPEPSLPPPGKDKDEDKDGPIIIDSQQVKPAHSHIDCTQAGNPPLNPTPPPEEEDDPPIVIKHHAGSKAHRMLAHELGHACGLLLHKNKPRQCCNLMHNPPNIRLSEKQADVVRVSRFVSIF